LDQAVQLWEFNEVEKVPLLQLVHDRSVVELPAVET
jgi:hypothetical protein